MEYITAGKIIEIHDEIMKEYGGTIGIRDEGTLELLAYKVNRVKTVFGRAALVLHTIVSAHPFFDGNKRTAIMAAENYILANILRALSCRRMDSFRSFFSSGVNPASFSATIVGSVIS